MHPKVSINTLCLPEAALDQRIELVARLGASAISVGIDEVGELGAKTTYQRISDAGLKVATLTHRAFDFISTPAAMAARDRLNLTIAAAETIGADTITFTTGGRGAMCWADAATRFVVELAPAAVTARDAGVILSLEPTSHLYADVSIAHRLSDTTALARAAGIQVGIDLFACWFDADIEDAIATAAPIIALVQVSDYVLGDRGLPCRAVPGDGAIPLDRLLSRIGDTGFDGYYDLEIIGPRLPAEGAALGIRRAVAMLGSILER